MTIFELKREKWFEKEYVDFKENIDYAASQVFIPENLLLRVKVGAHDFFIVPLKKKHDIDFTIFKGEIVHFYRSGRQYDDIITFKFVFNHQELIDRDIKVSHGDPSQETRRSYLYRKTSGKFVKGMETLCGISELWEGIDWKLKLLNKATELFNSNGNWENAGYLLVSKILHLLPDFL